MGANETFLGISSFSDSEEIIAGLFLTAAIPSERVKKVEEAFLFAAKTFNEKATIKLLELLEKSYGSMKEADWKEWTREKIREAFSDRLRELYWELRDARQDGTRYSEWDRKDMPVYESALVQTKLWIVKEVLRRDWAQEINSRSWKAFRFLVAAFEPDSPEHGKRKDESEDETRARGRRVFKEEQEGILKILRENIGDYFKPENLTSWLQQPHVPFAIQKVLILARARNGGMELVRRDIQNAEFLQEFRLDERTPSAIELAKYFLGCVAQLDSRVEKLKKAMKGDWVPPWDKIGESEYVKGEMKVVFRSLHDFSAQQQVILEITLPAECSEELGRDIFGRAKRHAEKWMKENGVGYLMLHAEGGTANLKLSKSYSKP